MIKKSLSLILSLAMLLAVFTVIPAAAEENMIEPAEGTAAQMTEETTEETVAEADDEALAAVGADAEDGEVPAADTGADVSAAAIGDPDDYPVITSIEDAAGGVKISWQPYGEGNIYCVYRKNGADWTRVAQSAATSCIVPQDAFTASVYTLRCIDSSGSRFTSGFNKNGWEHYYPGTPSIAFFANTPGGVRIFWKDSYEGLMRVFRKTAGGSWERLHEGVAFDEDLAYTDPADGSRYMYFTDTTAQNGQTYTYTIRVVNEAQTQYLTAHNGGRSFTRRAMPEITGVSNVAEGAAITWKSFSGAAAYRVYYHDERHDQRSWDKLTGGWKFLSTVKATSFTDKTGVNGEIRVYTVQPLDAKGSVIGDFDHIGVSDLYYAAPVFKKLAPEIGVDGEGRLTGAIRLGWDAVPGMRYRLYRRTADTSWIRLALVEGNTYLDETAAIGVKYYYTIRAVDQNGAFLSSFVSSKAICYTATPAIKQIENGEKGAQITWDPVAGADYYRVFYRSADGGWIRLATLRQTTFLDTSVKNGETRVYTIRTLNEEQNNYTSDFDSAGVSNTFFACPVIKTIECFDGGVKLTWDRTAGAPYYRVYRKVGSASWSKVAQTSGGAFTDTNVTSGTVYRYTLRIISADGSRYLSFFNSGKSVKYVDTPVITGFQNMNDGVRIAWRKVTGADKYCVFYQNGTGWTRLATLAQTEFVDKTVKNAERRVYTVRCLSNEGYYASAFNKNGWSNTFFAPPAITAIAPAGAGVTVSWKAQAGVAGYRLYRKPLGGTWSRVMDKTAATSYNDKTAKKDTIYAYTLRYVDINGNLISGYIDNSRYYCNGKLCNGNYSQGGTFGFKDGYLLKGLNRVNGLLRYYNSEGRMYRDTIVGYDAIGYYYTDADGVCCETKEMRLAAEFIAKYCKGSTLKEKMKYGFLYMANNYPYVRVYNDMPNDESDVPPFAVELFEQHKGTCYRYAAAYACVAKIAGYRSRFCYGYAGTLMHGWTEVYVDGEWLICDVDTQLPSYGFADYTPYMMRTHIWALSKEWYSELTVKNGKATWGRKTYF